MVKPLVKNVGWKLSGISVNLAFVALSIFFAYCVGFTIAEKYFFDKVMYRKSDIFGYTDYAGGEISHKHNSETINNRVKDLRNLIELAQEKHAPVSIQQKDKRVYTIAVIGDSVTYGVGVKQRDRYPDILQTRLNVLYPTRVFTLAESGDGILDNYAKFVLADRYLNPDLYIVSLISNDLIIDWTTRYPEEDQIFSQLKTQCPGPVKTTEAGFDAAWDDVRHKGIFATFNEYYVNKDIFPSFSQEYANICLLRKIGQLLAQANKKIIFFNNSSDCSLVPSGGDSLNTCPVMSQYGDAFRSVGLSVVDPFNIPFLFTPVSKSESHPSAATHRLYADSLYKRIVENSEYGFVGKH